MNDAETVAPDTSRVRPFPLLVLLSQPLFYVAGVLIFVPAIVLSVELKNQAGPGTIHWNYVWYSFVIAVPALIVSVLNYLSTAKLCRSGTLIMASVNNIGTPYQGKVDISYAYTVDGQEFKGRVSVGEDAVEKLQSEPSIPIYYDPLKPGRHVVGYV